MKRGSRIFLKAKMKNAQLSDTGLIKSKIPRLIFVVVVSPSNK